MKRKSKALIAWWMSVVLLILISMTGCGWNDDDADEDNLEEAAMGNRIYVTLAGDHEVVVIDEDSEQIVSRISVGEGPAIILKTPDDQKLYTANWGGNSTSVIDVETENVTDIMFDGIPYVIAMAPDGRYLYAGVKSEPSGIVVIDTSNDTIVKRFPTPELAASLTVSPDGEILYVATTVSGDPNREHSLYSISTADGSVIQDLIPVGSMPAWITIKPDGSRVYTLNFNSDDITVVDTNYESILDDSISDDPLEEVVTIATGAGSQGIIGNVTPDESLLYVTNFGSLDMVAIDTATNEVVEAAPVTFAGRPVGVNFNADGSRIYVVDYGPGSEAPEAANANLTYLLTGVYTPEYQGQVSIIDEQSWQRLATIANVGRGPTSVVVIEH